VYEELLVDVAMNYLQDVSLMHGDKDLGSITRFVTTINGSEYVVYHCRFYELKGWALWEHYIELDEPISFVELKIVN
jgi:hypothetical protein